jgi:hypothetical protein
LPLLLLLLFLRILTAWLQGIQPCVWKGKGTNGLVIRSLDD